MTSRIMPAIALCLVAAMPVRGEVMENISLADLDSVLTDAGFNPEMSVDDNGRHLAASMKAQGYNFDVRGRDCVDGHCAILVFFANFDLERPIEFADFKTINKYNDDFYRGRAYVLEKEQQIGIDMVVDLRGGVERDHILVNASRYLEIIQDFVKLFRESQGGN